MYVRDYMTANPFTLTPDHTVTDAMELMRSKKIKKIPVVKNDQLVGFITEGQLLEVSPSKATTLSIYEINYLLSKTKISNIMSTKLITVDQDSPVEEAALLLREHDITGLPVLHGGKLVGVITEMDIFNAFMEIMGLRDNGSRITISIGEDKPGLLAKLASTIASYDINIQHLAVGHSEMVVRINTTNIDPLVKALGDQGFNVISTHVYK